MSENREFERLYVLYCELHFKYFFDPIGLLAILVYTEPLKTPFMSGFMYVAIALLIRLPLFIKEGGG